MSEQPGGTTRVDGVDLDAVALAVRGCAGVDDLYTEPGRVVTTYLPGRRLDGLRLSDGRLTVAVRGHWDVPVVTVAAQIRSAVGGLVGSRVVDVVLSDLTAAPGSEGDPGDRPPALVPAVCDDAIPAPLVAPAQPVVAVLVVPEAGPSDAEAVVDSASDPEPVDPWMTPNDDDDVEPSSERIIPTMGAMPRPS